MEGTVSVYYLVSIGIDGSVLEHSGYALLDPQERRQTKQIQRVATVGITRALDHHLATPSPDFSADWRTLVSVTGSLSISFLC